MREMQTFASYAEFASPAFITQGRLERKLHTTRFHMIDPGDLATLQRTETKLSRTVRSWSCCAGKATSARSPGWPIMRNRSEAVDNGSAAVVCLTAAARDSDGFSRPSIPESPLRKIRPVAHVPLTPIRLQLTPRRA
jgi:hypothetical protein